MAMVFENPANGHREEISSSAGIWAFLFGSLYFAAKGLWAHFIVQLLISFAAFAALGAGGFVVTIIVALVYACMVSDILAANYRRMGWKEVSGQQSMQALGSQGDPSKGEHTADSRASVADAAPPGEDVWAVALAEYEGEERNQALWAKLFAQADGDEAKTKAAYLRARASQVEQQRLHAWQAAQVEQLARKQEQDAEVENKSPTVCPACRRGVLPTAAKCKCGAIFDAGSSWTPIPR